jgi:hypothetical protein
MDAHSILNKHVFIVFSYDQPRSGYQVDETLIRTFWEKLDIPVIIVFDNCCSSHHFHSHYEPFILADSNTHALHCQSCHKPLYRDGDLPRQVLVELRARSCTVLK